MMREKIIQRLHKIEQEHNIHIFYAVESGSRAWGFASPDSDYDVRFLYYHNPEWYFSISPQKDSLCMMQENNLLDFSGWELKKTLSLLLKSNMSLYEWLHSPVVYIQTEEYSNFAQLANSFFTPKALCFSYIHLAKGNYKAYLQKEEVKIKKYLYVLRTIAACRWIEKKHTFPPIEIEKLKNIFKEETEVFTFLNQLISAKKTTDELGFTSPASSLNRWIEQQIKHYKNYADNLPQESKDPAPLSHFLQRTILCGKK